MAKTIIFDFDGTLADSFELGYRLVNLHASRYGYQQIPRELVPELKKLSAWQACMRVGVKAWKIPRIARRIRREFLAGIEELPTFEGMPEALKSLFGKGYRLGILTSNNRKNVRRFLEARGLSGYFDFVYCDRSIFGKWKTMRRAIKKFRLLPSETLVVGDELRDLEAAWRNGLAFLAVSWGLNAREILDREAPGQVVDKASQLPGAVERRFAGLAKTPD